MPVSTLAPSLKRRLASMLYEAMLLFGVVFIAGWLFDTLTQSRHALTLRHARQVWLFIVLGVYFVTFWRRSGQTLAMKTWRMRLIVPGREKIPLKNAIARYLLAWMWFVPAMAIAYVFGLKEWASVGIVVLGMIAWAATARFDRDGQFLHDRLAGTRIVVWDLAPRKPNTAQPPAG